MGAQSNGVSTFKEISTLQLGSKPDSISWSDYDSLWTKIHRYNLQQKKKALKTADSMSRVEYPCYEFFVELQGDNSLEEIVAYNGERHMNWSSAKIPLIHCKWVILKRRRSKLKSTGSVICDDDYN